MKKFIKYIIIIVIIIYSVYTFFPSDIPVDNLIKNITNDSFMIIELTQEDDKSIKAKKKILEEFKILLNLDTYFLIIKSPEGSIMDDLNNKCIFNLSSSTIPLESFNKTIILNGKRQKISKVFYDKEFKLGLNHELRFGYCDQPKETIHLFYSYDPEFIIRPSYPNTIVLIVLWIIIMLGVMQLIILIISWYYYWLLEDNFLIKK